MSALSFSTRPRERRLAANRANAQFSTGPRTDAGKAKSSLNAVKTGQTGRTVLLPNEDVAAYQSHIAHCEKEFAPVDERERTLVQSLADTQWRLDRIPNLETGLFALGRRRYANLFEDETDEQIRAANTNRTRKNSRSARRRGKKSKKNRISQENDLYRLRGSCP